VKNKRHPASQEIRPQSLDYLDVLAKSRNFGSSFAQARKVWWLDEAGAQKPPDLVLVSTRHDFVDFLSGFTDSSAIAQCSTHSRGIKICQPEELLVWSLSNISAAARWQVQSDSRQSAQLSWVATFLLFPGQLGLSCAIQLDKIRYGKTELFHSGIFLSQDFLMSASISSTFNPTIILNYNNSCHQVVKNMGSSSFSYAFGALSLVLFLYFSETLLFS
jgi:hypothetical protein